MFDGYGGQLSVSLHLAVRPFARMGVATVLPVDVPPLPGAPRLHTPLIWDDVDARDVLLAAHRARAAHGAVALVTRRDPEGPVVPDNLYAVGTLFGVTGWSYDDVAQQHQLTGYALDPVDLWDLGIGHDGAIRAKFRLRPWNDALDQRTLARLAAAIESTDGIAPAASFAAPPAMWLAMASEARLPVDQRLALLEGTASTLAEALLANLEAAGWTRSWPRPSVPDPQPSSALEGHFRYHFLMAWHRQLALDDVVGSRQGRLDPAAGEVVFDHLTLPAQRLGTWSADRWVWAWADQPEVTAAATTLRHRDVPEFHADALPMGAALEAVLPIAAAGELGRAWLQCRASGLSERPTAPILQWRAADTSRTYVCVDHPAPATASLVARVVSRLATLHLPHAPWPIHGSTALMLEAYAAGLGVGLRQSEDLWQFDVGGGVAVRLNGAGRIASIRAS